MVKKIPNGEALGARTFGDLCKPKSGSSKPSALELRDRAADRIISLMRYGSKIDRLARNDFIKKDKIIEEHNKLAEQPKIVQFAYWRAVLDDLRDELSEIDNCGNEKRIEQIAPVISRQIEMTENKMRELFDEIRKER